jgi:hypothetical protein
VRELEREAVLLARDGRLRRALLPLLALRPALLIVFLLILIFAIIPGHSPKKISIAKRQGARK